MRPHSTSYTLWIAQTTVDSKETAARLARSMVQAHLAACAQIEGPIRSFYHWKGGLEDAAEWRITFKTSAAHIEPLGNLLRAEHPYETPEWVAWEANSSPAYGRWILSESTSEDNDLG